MSMKKIRQLLYIVFLLFQLNSSAQHVPHYTQYMYNMSILNPAYAGVRGDLSAGLLGRIQWVGVEGAPRTNTLFVNGRIANGLAMGVSIVQDKLGLYKGMTYNLDMSYTMVMSHYSRLSFGLKGGLNSYRNYLSQGITPDTDSYPDTRGSSANIGMGAFYFDEKFYAGISIPSLLFSNPFQTNNQFNGEMNINFFVTGGMLAEINRDLLFKPSFMLKYTYGTPVSFDINSNFYYNKKLEFGLSFRYMDSVSAMIAFIINENFRIGYSYDYTLTGLGSYYGDSHELMLLYDVNFKHRGRWLRNSSCYF